MRIEINAAVMGHILSSPYRQRQCDITFESDYYEEETSQSENDNEFFTEDEDVKIGPSSTAGENGRGTTPRPPST
uniref:Uncharacterized protein n=1 Tax=Caenorhabditis japonica TaxID=281687 RepID=A0A8R1IR68_CAEJA